MKPVTGRTELVATIERISQLVERHRGRGLTEQDTKNALIEPVMAALGWPKDDLDLVRSEYRHTSKYNPVDYALLSGGRPVMLVEAKALDVQINDHKVVSQVVSYAATVGVEWALVTNGAEWHLYSALALLDAGRKRVFAVKVAQPDAAEWLPWIAPGRLSGNLLGNLWHLVHAERQVREVINRLFTERNDAMVSLIASEGAIPSADVALALQVLQPSMSAASMDAIHQLVSRGGQASPAPVIVPAQAITVPTIPVPTIAPPPAPPAPNASVAALKPPPLSPSPVSPSDSGTPVTVRPTPGSKPVSVAIDDQKWGVGTWGDLLLAVLRQLHVMQPAQWDALFTAPDFEGRKSRQFQRSPDGLRSPKPIPGGFAELNLSAGSIITLVATLMSFFGLEPARARYTVREG